MISTSVTNASVAGDSSSILEVADSCTAIRINNRVYHRDSSNSPQFVSDNNPTPWSISSSASKFLSEDFSVVVDDSRIYRYDDPNNEYDLILDS